MEKFYKVYDLFGNEEKIIINKTKTKKIYSQITMVF
jgi:hypothetical protein